MFVNQIHLLPKAEIFALREKFGRTVQVHIVKIEAGGPVVEVNGLRGKYILVDMDTHISVQKYQPEPAVKLPHTNRSIEDLLG